MSNDKNRLSAIHLMPIWKFPIEIRSWQTNFEAKLKPKANDDFCVISRYHCFNCEIQQQASFGRNSEIIRSIWYAHQMKLLAEFISIVIFYLFFIQNWQPEEGNTKTTTNKHWWQIFENMCTFIRYAKYRHLSMSSAEYTEIQLVWTKRMLNELNCTVSGM